MKHQTNNDSDFKPMSLMSLLLSFVSLVIVYHLLFMTIDLETRHTLLGIDTAICALFLLQLTVDCYRSKQRLRYLRQHWLDIIASIPMIEVLRLARIVPIVRIVLLMIRHRQSFLSEAQKNRKEATLATIFTLLIVLITIGSTFMLLFEADASSSNIHSAGDALWWSLVTISTVGYGDHYPVTFAGKILATAMIICGVGIFGMISGLITSILSSPYSSKSVEQEAPSSTQLAQLLKQQQYMIEKIDKLEQQLEHISPKNPPRHDS